MVKTRTWNTCAVPVPVRVPEFFKVYLPDQSCHQLKIPTAFVKYFKQDFPCYSTLQISENNKWTVKVIKKDNYLFFEEGWQEFADANSLRLGDFIVFKCDGASDFLVKIYGTNNLEKQDVAARTEQEVKCEIERNRVETVETSVIDINSDSDTNCPPEKFRAPSSRLVLANGKTDKRKISLSRQSTRWKRSRSHVDCIGEGTESALGKANNFTSTHPYFQILIQPSYVTKATMNFPFKFMKEHMVRGEIELQVPHSEKLWTVKMKIYGEVSAKFSSNWTVFVKDNKIKKGDVCIFELTQRNRLQVHIFRC